MAICLGEMKRSMIGDATMQLYSVGHSDRTAAEFLELLDIFGIRCLVDVRAQPVSRRYPHFSRTALVPLLGGMGIDYLWLGPSLGGMRKSDAEVISPHVALHSQGMRAYADHMTSTSFRAGVEALLERAGRMTTAMMCAEKWPQNCHRSLLADYLAHQAVHVTHLLDVNTTLPHLISTFVRKVGHGLIYDHGSDRQLGLDL